MFDVQWVELTIGRILPQNLSQLRSISQPKADMAMLLQDFLVDIGDHPDYILAVVGEALLGRNCRSSFGGILWLQE